jgi:hypothetical protein
MNPSAKKRFLELSDALITEAEELQRKSVRKSGKREKSAVVYLDSKYFEKWLAGCRNLVFQLGRNAAPWSKAFRSPGDFTRQNARMILGRLLALREAIEKDLLDSVDVSAVYDDIGLVARAERFIQYNEPVFAGWIMRELLRKHLERIIDAHNFEIGRAMKTAGHLNNVLYANKFYDRQTFKHIGFLVDIGNDCAHLGNPLITESQVRKLAEGVREFMARFPISTRPEED